MTSRPNRAPHRGPLPTVAYIAAVGLFFSCAAPEPPSPIAVQAEQAGRCAQFDGVLKTLIMADNALENWGYRCRCRRMLPECSEAFYEVGSAFTRIAETQLRCRNGIALREREIFTIQRQIEGALDQVKDLEGCSSITSN